MNKVLVKNEEICECGHTKQAHLFRTFNPITLKPEGDEKLGRCSECINPRKENNWSHVPGCKKFKLKELLK